MEVVISTVRWPVPLYREIQRLANEQKKSINVLVVELLDEALKKKAGAENE